MPRATPKTLRARRRRALPVAYAILVARSLGWCCLALGLAAALLEVSGLPERWLREELNRRLAPIGSLAEFGELDIDWLGPGVTLEGFRVVDEGVTHLATERLYVALAPSTRFGLHLKRLDLDGGALRVRPALLEDVRALLELRGEEPLEQNSRELQLPSIQVRGFRVEADDASGRTHDLGAVDFSMTSRPGRSARLSGRLQLPGRGAERSGGSIFLHGVAGRGGDVELLLSAEALDFRRWTPPGLEDLVEVDTLAPRGLLALEARARLDLLGGRAPQLEVDLGLSRGSLSLPGTDARVEDLDLRLSAHYDARQGAPLASWDAWQGGGRFSAEWARVELNGGLHLGASARPGDLLELWVRAPRLETRTPELKAFKPRALLVRNLYDSLQPEGVVDAAVGFALRESWRPDASPLNSLEYAVRVVPVGEVRAAWNGWYLPEHPDVIPFAFPMPAKTRRGAVLLGRNARFPRRLLLDVDFQVEHPTGSGHVTFQQWTHRIDMPPFAPGYGKPEADLVIDVPRIALDEEMESCLYGLREEPELATLFEDYGIESGEAGALVRVSARAASPLPAVDVQVALRDVRATWKELPVPANELSGTVRVRGDGLGAGIVEYAVQARTASCPDVRVEGRQRRRALSREPHSPRELELEALSVAAEGLDVDGADLDLLCASFEGLGDALLEFDPRGEVNVELTGARGGPGATWKGAVEVTPGDGARVTPRAFPVESRGLRGRVLVEVEVDGTSSTGARTTTRLAPLLGEWRGGVRPSLVAEFSSDSPSGGVVRVAGLEPMNQALLDDLARAMGSSGEELSAGAGGLEVRGTVDASYAFELPVEPEEALHSQYDIYLRGNGLSQDGVELAEDLRGALTSSDGVMQSPQISARLDGTPLWLRDLEVREREGEWRASGDLRAAPLKLDRGLLSRFLDDRTTGILLDEFGFRGELQLQAARAALVRDAEGEFELSLSGSGTLSDVSASVGLPVGIRSARFDLEEFVLAGGELRTWGRLYDLYGRILDRDLVQARMLLSFYGSRFAVETLEGNFCRGLIHGARREGSSQELVRPVFSVDLREPFAFQTGLALENVDVGILLEDVFTSGIASRGRASGEVLLSGKLANLLSISGRGRGEVHDSVLWSVPVLRDLFSQLGFDATAVFDDMSAEFRVADGEILMEDMLVQSPLLNLEGRGTLGLDGTLNHDLQVKYSLVDRAGPLGTLIHYLQNALLSVAIRGDMARPKVFLRGALTGFFQGIDEGKRSLPLPAYSDLPARF